ncbi:hypothetical protein G7067_09185 [Leucobacter insecticola]|uniref:Cardiolipin synthase N-terminal domain-containing protein n=1 Tax=Leucobacter insecticola TaxID=2714934 RepID=A0A6G8FJJ6_9MICO|nr:hypothetical protein [Leucobacter insecticola]QIM16545.1 hypothetical protein G7067_09185 [Leucobacter insecticola]
MFPLFEFVWTVTVAVHFGLALLAVLSLSKVASALSVLTCAWWTILCALLPIIGSVLWFRIGKPKALRELSDDTTQ